MVNEIRSWDFKRTWEFFHETTALGITPEFAEYVSEQPRGKVADFRGRAMPKDIIDFYVKEHKLIMIDGVSCAGKTTFAEKVAEEYNLKVVDIDDYILRWRKEIMSAPLSREVLEAKLKYFEQYAMERWINELENILMRESDGWKKSVVLVSIFIYDMQRIVTADKLGRNFGGAVCFMLHEPLKTIKKRMVERERALGINRDMSQAFAKVSKDHYVVSQVLMNEITKMYLSVGVEASFVINHVTADKLFH